MNPEFQRYLWTEFSAQRLIVMPVLLAAAFAIAALDAHERFADVADLAVALFALLAFFWGTRRAADAVISELRQGTWDAQRMSAQGAFAMTWAKLFGATAYAWYGALMCVAVYLFVALWPFNAEWARWESRIDPDFASMPLNAVVLVLTAVTGQAAALASAMALLRKRRGERHVSVTFCHLAGFAVAGVLYWYLFNDWLGLDAVRWYGMRIPGHAFMLASAVGFMLWAILAAFRLMRAELLYRVRPWAWTGFAVYLAVWLTGLANELFVGVGARFLPQLMLGLIVIAAFVYLAFLFEEKNQVALRAWFRDIAGFRLARIAVDAPAWAQLFALSLLLALAVAVGATLDAEGALFRHYVARQLPVLVGAGALFLLRDLALLLYLNMGRNQQRGDTAGVLYLVMLYVLGPLLAHLVGGDRLVAVLAPIRPDEVAISLAAPAAQAALMVGLLVWRCERRPGTMQPAVRAAA